MTTEIYHDGNVSLETEEDVLTVRTSEKELQVCCRDLQSVVRLVPDSTMGKYVDVRVVAIVYSEGQTELIVTDKDGAHRILQGLQQFRLTNKSVSQNPGSIMEPPAMAPMPTLPVLSQRVAAGSPFRMRSRRS